MYLFSFCHTFKKKRMTPFDFTTLFKLFRITNLFFLSFFFSKYNKNLINIVLLDEKIFSLLLLFLHSLVIY